jgi:hypothetical protein
MVDPVFAGDKVCVPMYCADGGLGNAEATSLASSIEGHSSLQHVRLWCKLITYLLWF